MSRSDAYSERAERFCKPDEIARGRLKVEPGLPAAGPLPASRQSPHCWPDGGPLGMMDKAVEYHTDELRCRKKLGLYP